MHNLGHVNLVNPPSSISMNNSSKIRYPIQQIKIKRFNNVHFMTYLPFIAADPNISSRSQSCASNKAAL
jgi:hypothetical protein